MRPTRMTGTRVARTQAAGEVAEDTDELGLGAARRRDYEAASLAAARRLAERADRAGLVDVAYGQVDSPLGPLVAMATRAGLVRLDYGLDYLDMSLEQIAMQVSPRVLESPARLDPIRRELDEYFEGRRRRFDIRVDWSLVRGYTRDVLQATAAIPYGHVKSYREVAIAAVRPLAIRAAGNALSSNPIPIVVPCHRVVHSGGGLGGYTGGLERKRFLLRLEGALA